MSLKKHWKIIALTLFVAAVIIGQWAAKHWEAEHFTSGECVTSNCSLPATVTINIQTGPDAKDPIAISLNGLPANTNEVHVSFAMIGMNMGFNQFTLKKQADGSFENPKIYLPVCVQNRHDYLADFTVDGKNYRVPFDVRSGFHSDQSTTRTPQHGFRHHKSSNATALVREP